MRWGLSEVSPSLDLTKVQKITLLPPSLPPFLPLFLHCLPDSAPSNNSFLFSADVEYFEVAAVIWALQPLQPSSPAHHSVCWCFYNSSLENTDFHHWLHWIRGAGWGGGGFSKLLQMVITASPSQLSEGQMALSDVKTEAPHQQTCRR